MSAMQEATQKFRTFLTDVGSEMRKSTWPERQELVESTAAVVLMVLMLSAYIGVCDQVLVTLLKLIMP